ncbi:MAG TPA: U32 family peptidase [Anaerovoracaceae bacterium]|nr:U32 family peptidase [Anaerovoracaceae bacterium]
MALCEATLKRDKNKGIELLVPVGGQAQLFAAVNNGADAIYLGGYLFNARMKASNFNINEIEDAIDYCHLRGVKVYITVNTLILEEEMKKAIEYIAAIYSIGVDAVIVQDLGLARLINLYMPDLQMHLSTQGSVVDYNGVDTAQKLGFNRVVLGRELSVKEATEIASKSDVDIEIFVHGAICVSLSGQCHLSRYIGGRSGNRGLCAQPCRLPYRCLYENGEMVDDNAYPLSTKDLCLIDHIGELINGKVKSLKIEGRLKSPEYVATVTRIYRKYIDMFYEIGSCSIGDSDKAELLQIFNRNGFAEDADGLGDNMSKSISKNTGIYIGEVLDQQRSILRLKVSKEINMGDVLEIRNLNNKSFRVTYLEEIGSNIIKVGDIKERVKKRDKVYRVISKKLNDKAEGSFKGDLKKLNIDMDVYFYGANEFDSEYLRKIECQMKKTGNTPFAVDKVNVHGKMEQIKVSEINKLRRNAIAKLTEKTLDSYKRDKPKILEHKEKHGKYFKQESEALYYSIEGFLEEKNIGDGINVLLPFHEYMKSNKDKREKIHQKHKNVSLYLLPNESIVKYNVNVDEIKRIYVGSFGNISEAKNILKDKEIIADFGTNAVNSITRDVLIDLGANNVRKSLEISDNDHGMIPLMVIRQNINYKKLIDRKNESYLALDCGTSEDSGYKVIVPDKTVFRNNFKHEVRTYHK